MRGFPHWGVWQQRNTAFGADLVAFLAEGEAGLHPAGAGLDSWTCRASVRLSVLVGVQRAAGTGVFNSAGATAPSSCTACWATLLHPLQAPPAC